MCISVGTCPPIPPAGPRWHKGTEADGTLEHQTCLAANAGAARVLIWGLEFRERCGCSAVIF